MFKLLCDKVSTKELWRRMPNFEITWQTGVRERCYGSTDMTGLLYSSPEYVRVLVAPNRKMIAEIAKAMIGEQLRQIHWSLVVASLNNASGTTWPGDQRPSDKAGISDGKEYERVLSAVASIKETTREPTLGVQLGNPIPNDDWIWDRVNKKLGWSCAEGLMPVWATLEKTYTRTDYAEIDGVTIAHSSRTLKHSHKVGVLDILRGDWRTFDEYEQALKEAYQKLGLTMPS